MKRRTLLAGTAALVAAPAIVWANAFTFVQAGYILAVKLQTERKPAARAHPEGMS